MNIEVGPEPYVRLIRDELKGVAFVEIDYELYYKVHTAEKAWPKETPRNIKAGQNVILELNSEGDWLVSQRVKKVAVPMSPGGYPLQYFDENNKLRDWKVVRDFEEDDVKPLIIEKNMVLKVQPFMTVEERETEVIVNRSDLENYFELRKLLNLH